MEYIKQLKKVYAENGKPKRASQQEQYMRNKFEFYGLTSPERKILSKPFLEHSFLPSKVEAHKIAKLLWEEPKRELQHFTLDLLEKYAKKPDQEDIKLYEWMITHKSWWDTVDFIAPTLAGNYFKIFPNKLPSINKKWLTSNNIWLQRSTLIFQLKYKDQTNTDLLTSNIRYLLGSKEFFINKAIGWSLRQYARHNPHWVIGFVENTPQLSGLSRREAMKHLE
jgi:3-methyladenine DNA glycosylase AlkD